MMIRRISGITSVILLFLMVFSSVVIGKGWLSKEEIKSIASEAADSVVQYDVEMTTGKQIRSFYKLDFDSIQIIPVTPVILTKTPPRFPSFPTLNEEYERFYLVKYFKNGLLVGKGKIDVYGGDCYPGVKRVRSVKEPYSLPQGIFDPERAKQTFEEKTGESVCLITLAQYYIEEPVTIHTPLGSPIDWLIITPKGTFLMTLSGEIKLLSGESIRGGEKK